MTAACLLVCMSSPSATPRPHERRGSTALSLCVFAPHGVHALSCVRSLVAVKHALAGQDGFLFKQAVAVGDVLSLCVFAPQDTHGARGKNDPPTKPCKSVN